MKTFDQDPRRIENGGVAEFKSIEICQQNSEPVLCPDWMSRLSDDLPTSAITIPGTHDSAAYTLSWPFVQTQKIDIPSQLNAGIRYFDFRCALNDDDEVVMVSSARPGE